MQQLTNTAILTFVFKEKTFYKKATSNLIKEEKNIFKKGDFNMSCKSGIYTANSRVSNTVVGDIVQLGSVVRRFGRNLELSGDTIYACGQGYYNVDVNITFAGKIAGDATFQIYENGVPVPGAKSTVTVSTPDTKKNTLSIPALIRNCDECCRKAITIVVSGIDVITHNVGVVVVKE